MTSTTSASSSSKAAIIGESSTLASTRLVRHVDAKTPQANNDQSQNIRQQRSFHSSGGNGHSFEDVDSRRKHKAIQRRQQIRTPTNGDGTDSAGRRNQRYRTQTPNRQSSTLSDKRPSTTSNASDDLKTRKVTTVMFPGNETEVKFTILHNQQTPKT